MEEDIKSKNIVIKKVAKIVLKILYQILVQKSIDYVMLRNNKKSLPDIFCSITEGFLCTA